MFAIQFADCERLNNVVSEQLDDWRIDENYSLSPRPIQSGRQDLVCWRLSQNSLLLSLERKSFIVTQCQS